MESKKVENKLKMEAKQRDHDLVFITTKRFLLTPQFLWTKFVLNLVKNTKRLKIKKHKDRENQ